MPEIDCDVLVIGGGLAGCWAAIKAREKAQRVLLVEKGKVARSGKSAFAGAGILCPLPGDDLDAWQKEIVVRGEYLADQDAVKALLEEQPARISEMGQWGLHYERDKDGNLVRTGGLGSITTRVVTISSQEMIEVLRRRMQALGVNVMERVYVTGLLTSDGVYPTRGAVVGCYGFHTRTGEPYVIKAAATVIATGGTGYFYFFGDGIAMGYRAGAEVWGMEFTRTMDEMSFHERFQSIHLITFQRLGMRLYNRLGERFMERYYPEQKENTARRQMAFAVIVEQLEGRGPVYADLTHLDPDSLHKLRTLPSTALRVAAIEREGVNFGQDRIKFDIDSGFIFSESGGLKLGLDGSSSLPGLYVAGEAGGFPANGSGSIPLKLASCCVEGYRAGEAAARYATQMGNRPIKREQLKLLEADAFRPITMRSGIPVEDLMDRVYEYLRPAPVSIFRSEKNMNALLAAQQSWLQEASMVKASDWHGLVVANQKKNYIECVGLVFRSSLERKETRGMNIRIDYPYRDDAGWLKQVVQKLENDGIRVTHVPVPIHTYPVKPDKYEKVPIKIPFPRCLTEGVN